MRIALTPNLRVAKLKCDQCLVLLEDGHALKHHKRKQGDPQFSCTQCDTVSWNKGELYKHLNIEHGEQDSLTCNQCGRVFSCNTSHTAHQKNIHGYDDTKYPCNLCDEVFGKARYLEAHIKGHTSSFTCKECRNTYKTLHSLEDHTNGVHRQGNTYGCDNCGKAFNRKGTMLVHKRTHTCPNFLCIYCSRTYGSKRSLMNHEERTHPGLISQFRKGGGEKGGVG